MRSGAATGGPMEWAASGGWVRRGEEGVVMVTGELLWPVIICADVDKPEVGSAMMGGATEPVTVCRHRRTSDRNRVIIVSGTRDRWWTASVFSRLFRY